jgi:23S rRNA pseudouridine2605 synthase
MPRLPEPPREGTRPQRERVADERPFATGHPAKGRDGTLARGRAPIPPDEQVRLQKALAEAGLGSRREIEGWIRAGRVVVNGRSAQLGDRVGDADRIEVDGRPVSLQGPAAWPSAAGPDDGARASGPARPATAVLLYHKPVGEVTTRRDPEGRPTVFDALPPVPGGPGRWIVVGRLDFTTSGLLLFTNDGELAHRLMHPSSEIEREYRVRVQGEPDPGVLARLRDGIRLEDGWAHFERLVPEDGRGGSNASFRVVLREGRNREVRRLWSAAGHEVQRLERVRFGPQALPADLAPGRSRLATAAEVAALQRTARSR